MIANDDDLNFHHRRSIEEGVRASEAEDKQDWAIHRTLSKLHAIAAEAIGEVSEREASLNETSF